MVADAGILHARDSDPEPGECFREEAERLRVAGADDHVGGIDADPADPAEIRRQRLAQFRPSPGVARDERVRGRLPDRPPHRAAPCRAGEGTAVGVAGSQVMAWFGARAQSSAVRFAWGCDASPATRVPDPERPVSHPSTSSCSYAWVTVPRDSPS